MAQALGIVKHSVNDYATWKNVYDEVQPLRDQHGVTAATVLRDPADPNNITVLHWFPSLENAQSFTSSPDLKAAMAKAGVAGAPRIELVVEA